MSRIGKLPIKIPDKVKVAVEALVVTVEGPKGRMQVRYNPGVMVNAKDGQVTVSRPDDTRASRALHGLTRTLINNAVRGVTHGYEEVLEITGVGFRAEVKGREVHFAVGYSHPAVFALPEGISCEVDKQTRVILKGVDKHLLGLCAAKVRGLRPPEPYKGKGIQYAGEKIRRKVGKQGAA
jgi:large subunit ribosomal protein L6